MTGDIGERMIVRFEGKSRVKGNTEKFNRCRSRDNLTVIRDVLWFEHSIENSIENSIVLGMLVAPVSI